jgi:hypothetical protein
LRLFKAIELLGGSLSVTQIAREPDTADIGIHLRIPLGNGHARRRTDTVGGPRRNELER